MGPEMAKDRFGYQCGWSTCLAIYLQYGSCSWYILINSNNDSGSSLLGINSLAAILAWALVTSYRHSILMSLAAATSVVLILLSVEVG
jgi:hypothetical protein